MKDAVKDSILGGLTVAATGAVIAFCGKRKVKALLWVGAAELLTFSIKRLYDVAYKKEEKEKKEEAD